MCYLPAPNGEVAEWSKAHAWKVCIRQRIEGSNPSLSANILSHSIYPNLRKPNNILIFKYIIGFLCLNPNQSIAGNRIFYVGIDVGINKIQNACVFDTCFYSIYPIQ